MRLFYEKFEGCSNTSFPDGGSKEGGLQDPVGYELNAATRSRETVNAEKMGGFFNTQLLVHFVSAERHRVILGENDISRRKLILNFKEFFGRLILQPVAI